MAPRRNKRARYENEITDDNLTLGEGSGFAAQYQDNGTTSYEETRVPLYPAPPPADNSRRNKHLKSGVSGVEHVVQDDNFNVNNDYNPGDEPKKSTGRKKSQSDHIQDFSEKFHHLLAGLLAGEAIPEGKQCDQCSVGNIAIWRCRDCTSSRVLCRACMRNSHNDNPLHRIQRWTGMYFERAMLWEVGASIVIPHHNRVTRCSSMAFQLTYLTSVQEIKDHNEQQQLRSNTFSTPVPSPIPPVNLAQQADDLWDDDYAIADSPDDADDEDIPEEEDVRPDEPEPTFDWVEVCNGVQTLETEESTKSVSQSPSAKPGAISHPGEPETESAANSRTKDTVTAGRSNQSVGSSVDASHPLQAVRPVAPSPPAAPRADAMNNPFVRVVHTNGVHNISLVYCGCQGTMVAHQDLLYGKLLPTTFVKYSTLFTTEVLDDFRLSNLECKTSAYQYFQKLRRKTSPTAPNDVPNKYQELRRLSREWRWFKQLKWAGYGQTKADPTCPKPGELTLFCPTCPQPHINLPEDWNQDENRNLYLRSYVADGNFKADHVRRDNGAWDIWLSEGGGMMPIRAEYKKFLDTHENMLTRAACQNLFRVIELAMMHSKSCDRTGLVSIACARHGCYAPNSLVDLFHGEQQRNVDFAFVQALKTTNVDGIQRVLLIYDIACQYYVNMHKRIGPLLPLNMVIDRAIGMFHVHGHQEECFYRFAPSFIPGAANVAGEILEHLWSGLNPISSSTRTMTLAARAETLNDHTSDSNFKKTIGMAAALCKSYQKAREKNIIVSTYYAELASAILPSTTAAWDAAMVAAEKVRLTTPSAMDILKANPSAGKGDGDDAPAAFSALPEDNLPISRWFYLAMQIEEKQLDVINQVVRLRRNAPASDRNKIDASREQLTVQFGVLASFEREIGSEPARLFDVVDDDDFAAFDKEDDKQDGIDDDTFRDESLTPANFDDPFEIVDNDNTPTTHIQPERRTIAFPSNVIATDEPTTLPDHSMAQFRKLEWQFRCHQASVLLTKLRELIAERSFQYSHVQRNPPTKGVKTRSRTATTKMRHTISMLAKMYTRNRARLQRLNIDAAALATFKKLSPSDLVSSTAVIKQNEPGSKDLTLSWIWQVGSDESDSSPERVEEFRRVHYLRAHAAKQRWNEEYQLVGHEMTWTVAYYIHQAHVWHQRAQHTAATEHPGVSAYALRKEGMWMQLARDAERRFRSINPNYIPPNTK